MASKQSEELNQLYRKWVAAFQANPEMSRDEMRHMFEQWPRITGEPGGVDYIETDAGGIPALWAAPKNCAQDRVVPRSAVEKYNQVIRGSKLIVLDKCGHRPEIEQPDKFVSEVKKFLAA